ncbi:hypothetical protein ACVBEF_12255 [Glaciimonas sp. GG7]
MNPPCGTIARKAPEATGLDYSKLLAEGTALVQALSGNVWTNFNYSDPGVTILEQLCYALTELSYRADIPVEDLLGAPLTGEIALPRQGLYPAWAIMPINPVTINDLRRLIIDRVSEVANVWFTPVPAKDQGVCGLYRITVLAYSEDCECDHTANDNDALITRVRDCYSAHRALCEDLQTCHVLWQIPARVDANIYLDDASDPDEMLAQLLFTLGLTLTPEPKRRSLAEQQALGLTTSEIFLGSLMLRGFIADDQLTPLPRNVVVETLLEAMVEIPGVLSIDTLTVHVGNDVYTVNDTIAVAEGCILRLQTSARGRFDTLRLFKGGVVCTPNPNRVRRLLDRKWTVQRQTPALWTEYSHYYCPPVGQGNDLTTYSSVQDQFPAVYGIGYFGLPSEADARRRAQAKQLKGYLMAFDQLMADFFSQLAFVRDLFSINTGGDKTYASQSLIGIVPNVLPLVDARHYDQQLTELIAAHDPVFKRQSAILDLLLSLYASGLDARGVRGPALLQAKRTLLTRVVPATRDRGRGFDYRRAMPLRPMAGLEIRCRIELALLDVDTAPSATEHPLERERLIIVEWVLLRHGTLDEQVTDECSFRISAVMAAMDEPMNEHQTEDILNDGWRRRARAVVRDNTPAHIVVEDIFLGARRMQYFLRLYDKWIEALRHGSVRRRGETSRRLRRFLRPAKLLAVPVPLPVTDVQPDVQLDIPPALSPELSPSPLPESGPSEIVPILPMQPMQSTLADAPTNPEPESAPAFVTAPAPERKWWQFWRPKVHADANPVAPDHAGTET